MCLTLLFSVRRRWRRACAVLLGLSLQFGFTLMIPTGWGRKNVSLPLMYSLLIPFHPALRRWWRRTGIIITVAVAFPALENILDAARNIHPVGSGYRDAVLFTIYERM
jgi:hypothetical protein